MRTRKRFLRNLNNISLRVYESCESAPTSFSSPQEIDGAGDGCLSVKSYGYCIEYHHIALSCTLSYLIILIDGIVFFHQVILVSYLLPVVHEIVDLRNKF